MLALGFGALTALGDVPLLFVSVCLVAGLSALLIPLEWLLWSLIVLTFFVQGPVIKILLLPAAAWAPYGLSLLVFVRALIDRIGYPSARESSRIGVDSSPMAQARSSVFLGPVPNVLGWVLSLYLLMFGVSALINLPSPAQLAVGLKTTLPFWSVTFALLFNRWEPKQIDRLWRWVPWGLALQVPIVLYQVFVIVPRLRSAGDEYAFDAVVGSFGGDGGNSSFLVIYGIAASILAIARAKAGVTNPWLAVLTVGFSIALTLAGEVKAAFFWVPLAFILAFHDEFLRRPGHLFLAVGGLMGFLVATALVYQAVHWRSSNAEDLPLEIAAEHAARYFFSPAEMDFHTGEISRGASIMLWVNDAQTDWPNRLVGYGPAASRAKSVVAVGSVARRFDPLWIAATTASMLLWDGGLIALVLFCALLIVGLRWALQGARDAGLAPTQRAWSRMAAGLFGVFLTMLVYDRALVDEPCTQLLLALLIGHLAWVRANRPGTVD